MSKNIFIVGTNTDIGKTFVSGGIMHTLNKENMSACYFKPVQSGVEKNAQYEKSDVAFIKTISGAKENQEIMNTYSFKEPVSPHLAAKREDVLIDREPILRQYKKLKNSYEYVIVEGSGGVIVPLKDNYYIYDLIKDMDIEVIVVADSGVGTINHTYLTIEFLKRKRITVNGIIINRYKGNFYEDDNIKMIEKICKVKVKALVEEVKDDLKSSIIREYNKSFKKNIVLELFKDGEYEYE